MPKKKSVPLELRFDEVRAEQAFRLLNDLWRERHRIGTDGHRQFGDIVLPQDIYPRPADPIAHAIWLYVAAIFMRGGVVSEDPFAPLNRLSRKFPWMFDPAAFGSDAAVPKNEADVLAAFDAATVHNNKKEEHAKAWVHNMRLLADHWSGNPLLMFRGVRDFEEAFARINLNRKTPARRGPGILGMRRKIFSLFVIWLQEAKLVKMFPCPIPVDFHAMRLLWALSIMEIVQAPAIIPKDDEPGQEIVVKYEAIRITEKFVDIITKWTQDFIHNRVRKKKLSHLFVNPALWCLSRDMCAGHFQNGSVKNGAVYRESHLLRSGSMRWPRKYRDRCAVCPVQAMCGYAVPNKTVYRWGILMRMLRVPYPAKQRLLPGTIGFTSLWRHKSDLLRRSGHFHGKKTVKKIPRKPRDTPRDLFAGADQESNAARRVM